MIAALVHSTRPGKTGWVSRQRCRVASIQGLEDSDELILYEKMEDGTVQEKKVRNGLVELTLCEFVRLHHVNASGNPVYVDLRI